MKTVSPRLPSWGSQRFPRERGITLRSEDELQAWPGLRGWSSETQGGDLCDVGGKLARTNPVEPCQERRELCVVHLEDSGDPEEE